MERKGGGREGVSEKKPIADGIHFAAIGLAIQLQLRVPKRQAAYLKHVSRLISGRIKRRKSFFSDEVDAPESVTFPVASFSWSASRCLCRIFRKKRLPLLFVIELPLV